MRKQEAPGSIQTNWLLANQVVCLRKQGAQGLAVLSKAWNIRLGTRQVFRKFQSQNVCLEDTKASVVKEKRLQTDQSLGTGESRKGSWRQNGLEGVPIPEDWAWAGRRAGAQRKAGQGESNLESLTSPRTTHTSLLFLISQPCWVCILICPRMRYIHRESLRSGWVNLSNAPFKTRVFRPRLSSLPKSLLLRARLVRAPSAARTGKRKLEIRRPGLFPTCRIRRCTLTRSANICVHLEVLPCVISGISPTLSRTS